MFLYLLSLILRVIKHFTTKGKGKDGWVGHTLLLHGAAVLISVVHPYEKSRVGCWDFQGVFY